ncbi:SHOCT domain-containing protein [Blastococcus litoris]|uniref:SHOCT domain-containing protein n=1 Tax=Blastococcus litoris TaxID=2171622 RepID=UPI000E304B12|nr:SHOCT domain-containing protein [Blastococcus litoris]
MRRFVAGVLIVVSAVTLVLASASLWLRRNIINTDVFVSNVQTVVDLPEVEARITDRVTTTVMTNPQVQDAVDEAVAVLPERLRRFEPTVESGIQNVVAAGVQRLLSDDPFRPLTTAAMTSVHDQLVAGEPLEFTLGQAKDRVPDSLRDGIAGQVLDLLPDDLGVTLLSPADSPQVYTAIDVLESAWWWLGLIAVATLVGALGVSRRRGGTVRAWAVTVTVLAVVVLAALRIGRGLLLPQVRAENRDAVGAIYDVLAGSLRSWTLWVFALALLLVVLTVVWGRTGLVAGVRRGLATGRAQLLVRREEARAARAATAMGGAADGTGTGADEPWTRRVAAWWRGFAAGLDLPARTATVGAAVRDHFVPARWAGIGLGALLLLFWPAPTLSVLIWIVALVVLYVGALDWLRDRAAPAAPEAPPASRPAVVPAGGRPVAGNGSPVTPAVVPTARSSGADGAPPADGADRAAPELVPAALTPQAISTLSSRLDLLVRLGAARDSGVLSEDEFRHEKDRLLSV